MGDPRQTAGNFAGRSYIEAMRVPTARPELKVLPVTLPMTRVPVGIVTLKNRTPSPVAKLFIDHARDVARPLAKGKIIDACRLLAQPGIWVRCRDTSGVRGEADSMCSRRAFRVVTRSSHSRGVPCGSPSD